MSCCWLFHKKPRKTPHRKICHQKGQKGRTGPTGATGATGQPGPGTTPSYFSGANPESSTVLSDPTFHQTPINPLTGTPDIIFTAPSQVTMPTTGDYLVGYTLTIDGTQEGAMGNFAARVASTGITPQIFLVTTNTVNNNINSASSQNIIPVNAGDILQFQVQYGGSGSVAVSDTRFFVERVSS
jgi:hypothetical protein